MFLGYQINEQGQEFIAGIADTCEELENNKFIRYSRIEETKDDYKLVNGSYITITEAFEKEKESKRAEINQARDRAEQGGFKYLGRTFDSDPISCIRIQGAAQMASQLPKSTEPAINWTCQDNSTIMLTVEELIGLSNALVAWSNECHQKATKLKEQIELAETEEDLNKIVW